MSNSFKTATLCAVVWLVSAGMSYADGGNWLDKLSGPGPFGSPTLAPTIGWTLACVGKDSRNPANTRPVAAWVARRGHCEEDASNPTAIRGLIRARYTHLVSRKNDLFPDDPTLTAAQQEEARKRHQVAIDSIEFGAFARLSQVVDVGTALSLDAFHGEAFDAFARTSFKPIEVVVSPLAPWGGPRFRALQISASARTFYPSVDEHDFCRAAECATVRPFTSKGEYSLEVLTTVDLGYLIFKK